MFELIFTVCLNHACTNTVLMDGLIQNECIHYMQTIDAGEGSLNCVAQFERHWRPYDTYQIDIEFNAEENRHAQ